MISSKSSLFGEPTSHQICIVYDAANGQVIHTHEAITYPNGRQVTEADVKTEALALLSHTRGINISKLETLFVQPADYEHGKLYQVDVLSRRLVVLS